MGFVSANSPEYMVVETGLGGLLDTTNTIDRKDKICVITPIGFDHMHILGNTLEEIAGQKAGIIQENQVVITCNQDPKVMRVIQERVRQKKAKLLVVDSLDLDIPNTQLVGEYNKVNLSLALAVCIVLSKRDGWDLDIYKALEAINSMVIPGRREVIKKSKTWIFDGAHNPQKMKALASTVDNVGVILAVKEGYKELIKILKPHAKEIILTKHLSPESDQPIKDISPSSEYRFFADQEELIRYVKSSKIQTWLVT